MIRSSPTSCASVTASSSTTSARVLVTRSEHDRAQVAERVGDEPRLARAPCGGERALGERRRGLVVTLEQRDGRPGRLRPPQEQRILVGRRREHDLEVPPRLAQMPTDVPEPAQCDRQPQRALAFTRLQEERERRACVVVLELEAREPLGLALSAQLGLGALGEREEPLGMPSPRRLGAELLQTLGGVLANRLEQAVPRLALRSPNEEERGVCEALHEVQGAALVAVDADRRDGLERRSATEDGQPRE